MSYTVDLERDFLHARSEPAAREAAAIMKADDWMRKHVEVSVSASGNPVTDDCWHLIVETYDGCYWHEPAARKIWLAIAPFLRDDAFLEFREEGGSRYRIRWEAGRVFEEFPAKVIWELECEITTELLAEG